MRNGVRIFVSLWYLLGWVAHVYLGLAAPETYRVFGSTALIPAYTTFWNSFVMPHITIFALLLAAFEVFTGILLASKGRRVKAGLTLSILFNVFLVQMGLGFPASNTISDLLINRGPNLLFVALQLPLLRGWDERSIREIVLRR